MIVEWDMEQEQRPREGKEVLDDGRLEREKEVGAGEGRGMCLKIFPLLKLSLTTSPHCNTCSLTSVYFIKTILYLIHSRLYTPAKKFTNSMEQERNNMYLSTFCVNLFINK